MEKITYNQIAQEELELVHMRINGLLGGNDSFQNLTEDFIKNGKNLDERFDFYIDEDGDPCVFPKGTKI